MNEGEDFGKQEVISHCMNKDILIQDYFKNRNKKIYRLFTVQALCDSEILQINLNDIETMQNEF